MPRRGGAIAAPPNIGYWNPRNYYGRWQRDESRKNSRFDQELPAVSRAASHVLEVYSRTATSDFLADRNEEFLVLGTLLQQHKPIIPANCWPGL